MNSYLWGGEDRLSFVKRNFGTTAGRGLKLPQISI
jgi:hypothetical protein